MWEVCLYCSGTGKDPNGFLANCLCPFCVDGEIEVKENNWGLDDEDLEYGEVYNDDYM